MSRGVAQRPDVSFIGRAVESEQLQGLVGDVSRGVGRVAIIEGEPGIGKSRLLEVTVDTARQRGFQVLSGAAHAIERDRAFGVLIDAFGLRIGAEEPIQREIAAHLAGRPGAAGGPDIRFRVAELVVDLIEVFALRSPTVVAIEDLHWADPSTLLAVHRLATSIAHLPVALLLTTRPGPRSPELTSLLEIVDTVGGQRVELGPFGDDEVRDLIVTALGSSPGPRLATKVAAAAGNPLFVSELLSALVQEGLIESIEGVAEVADAATPPSLTLTILRRLAFLSEESLETLRIASVLGAAFSLTDLAVVMGRTVVDLLPVIEEAKMAGLLGESGEDLAFRHDLVRDAIYEDMLQPVRKALHAQAARALADAGAPASRIATHAALGADVGDLEAIEWLTRAATETLARSPTVSIDLLERALELADRDVIGHSDLGRLLADTYLRVGRWDDAARMARELLAGGIRSDDRIEVEWTLFSALSAWEQLDEALAEIDSVAAGRTLTPTEQARLAAARAKVVHGRGTDLARPTAQRAIELGELAGDPLSVFVGRQTLSFCDAFDGYINEAIRGLDRANEMAVAARVDEHHVGDERINRRMYLVWADRFDEAAPEIDAAMAEVEAAGAESASSYHYTKAHLELWAGRWDEAVAVAEAGLAVVESAGFRVDRAHLLQLLCYVAIQRDDLAAAEPLVDKLVPGAFWAPALFAEAKGDTRELGQWLDGYREVGVNSPRPWHMSLAIFWAPEWVRLYLDAGDRRSALVMTEMLEDAARRARTPTAQGAALRCRGLYQNDPGLLLSAVDMYRTGPRVFDRAQACEWAAACMATQDVNPEAGVALLEEALEVYESVGALRPIARAEAHLRALGVRRGRRGPRRRPKAGWESLTESELRVTALVEQGLSYREIGDRLFISKRTVETHVAHVFGKLGLASRRELAEAVRERSA